MCALEGLIWCRRLMMQTQLRRTVQKHGFGDTCCILKLEPAAVGTHAGLRALLCDTQDTCGVHNLHGAHRPHAVCIQFHVCIPVSCAADVHQPRFPKCCLCSVGLLPCCCSTGMPQEPHPDRMSLRRRTMQPAAHLLSFSHAGMPGLLGGVAAAVASVWAYHPNKALLAHGHHQWGYQLLALLCTLGEAACVCKRCHQLSAWGSQLGTMPRHRQYTSSAAVHGL